MHFPCGIACLVSLPHPRSLSLPTLQALTPTITQVRERLGLEFSKTGLGAADAKKLPASGSGSNGATPVSRAAVMTAQAEAAAREVSVSRRQADAQQWIAAWRSRSRGNRKAAAAAAAQRGGSGAELDRQRLEQARRRASAGEGGGAGPADASDGTCAMLHAACFALTPLLSPRLRCAGGPDAG